MWAEGRVQLDLSPRSRRGALSRTSQTPTCRCDGGGGPDLWQQPSTRAPRLPRTDRAPREAVRRSRGPAVVDDRFELDLQQVGIVHDQVDERGRVREVSPGRGVRRSHRVTYALIACGCSAVLLIAILRGLACSATGICRVSTPAS